VICYVLLKVKFNRLFWAKKSTLLRVTAPKKVRLVGKVLFFYIESKYSMGGKLEILNRNGYLLSKHMSLRRTWLALAVFLSFMFYFCQKGILFLDNANFLLGFFSFWKKKLMVGGSD